MCWTYILWPWQKKCCLQIKSSNGSDWVEVEVKKGVKAIVLLNLQSYAGGRDLWGLKDLSKDQEKGWKTPIFNDGLIEVTFEKRHSIKPQDLPPEWCWFASTVPASPQNTADKKSPILTAWPGPPEATSKSILLVVLQVVGLLGGYHTAAVMGGVNKKIHAKRLAQASEVMILLQAESRSQPQPAG